MTVWTHVGNCSKFTVTPDPEIKEHYSYMGGIREMDKIAVTTRKATFQMVLDEWVMDNVAMAALGLQATDSVGDYIQIMGATSVERQLKFEAANSFGPQHEIILNHVFMICKDPLDVISENGDWGKITLTGNILRLNPPTGHFGTIRDLGTATGGAPLTAPNTLNYMIGTGQVYTAPLA